MEYIDHIRQETIFSEDTGRQGKTPRITQWTLHPNTCLGADGSPGGEGSVGPEGTVAGQQEQ